MFIWDVRKTSVAVDPKPAEFVELGNGAILHIWAEPGTYEIKVTVITIVDCEKKLLEKAQFVAPLEVTAVAPGPGPIPVPVPDPTDFKAKVLAALAKVDPSALGAKTKISDVYLVIANEATASSSSWDAATMVNEAKVRNTTVLTPDEIAKWVVFWPELATAFKDLKLAPEDLQGHIKAFRELAEYLK
jgi:hypothetical protein